MSGVSPEQAHTFDQAYREYLSAQWVRFALVSAGISIVLVPIFAVLDYLVYPEWFFSFLILRLACAAGIALTVSAAVYWSKQAVPLVSVASLIVIQLLIAYMIAITEGERSGYYAGLNLPLIAIGLFLPAVFRESMLFCVFSLFLYVLACLRSESGSLGTPFVEHIFFLSSTGVIAMFSTWFLERRRKKEFALSFELEDRIRELAYLNRKRSDFFSNISHELRTPLTLILAPVQEILSSPMRLPDALAGRLVVVRDNGLRLLKLVNELLDLIRLEEGFDDLDIRAVDANQIANLVVDGMLPLADAKGLSLHKEFSEERLMVEADQRALEKVIVNLVGNAIKFTEGSGFVRVLTRRDGEVAWICVEDNGIGISRSEQGHIFDRFRQADGSLTRRYRGTGLGLALVKEMAERMQGVVSVESEPGRGTKMAVRLKISGEAQFVKEQTDEIDYLQAIHRMAERQGGIAVDAPSVSIEHHNRVFDFNRASVLLVEDEPDMRRYLADVLERDYQVWQARDGREGLRLAREREPDLIVLDLMLPEIDGLEVCRLIRNDPPKRPIRIMLLTARADEQSKLTALENGADDFLTKPFSTLEVRTRLRNLLQNARLERDLAARNARLETALAELEATQAQLIQSEKLNALGSLSAGLLHEINNPLNYSLTALQLLGSDPTIQSNDLMREIVGDIDEGMQRIRAIVSDLRAFAYPSEAEKQVCFDFNEAVEAARRFAAHELRGIEVKSDLPRPSWVVGSKSHLTQVMVNLFTNAAAALATVGDDRDRRIGIVGQAQDGRFRIWVTDNGSGMEGTTLSRIFDPFFTTRDVGEGMGLGLSICHTIISNHQGKLAASSRLGEGSKLTFDLALGDGETG